MALVNKNFSDIVTFTRASNAWYFNSAGVLTQAASNLPRLDYNPSTLAPNGLLVEEQRTNLLTYSEQFDNAAWAKTRSSITADTVVAPDGKLTGDKLVEDTTASTTHFTQQTYSGYTSGTSYTVSLYVKAAERNAVQVVLGGSGVFGAVTSASFSLVDGSVIASQNTPTTTATNVGNGWWRLTVSKTATATASSIVQIVLYDGSINYTGDGTSGLYIWGAQLEAGAFATSYIPTTTAAATRAADVAVITGANFNSFYRADEGTFFVEGVSLGGAVAGLYEVSASGAAAQSISVRLGQKFSYAQGVNRASFTYTAGTTIKHGFAYKANDYAAAVSGSSLSISSQPTDVPTGANLLTLGALNTNTFQLNGWLRRIVYYPRRLSNTELQGITA